MRNLRDAFGPIETAEERKERLANMVTEAGKVATQARLAYRIAENALGRAHKAHNDAKSALVNADRTLREAIDALEPEEFVKD